MRFAGGTLTPLERADLLRELIGGVYDAVRFDSREGGGLDGHDGPERDALGKIVGAAEDHYHAELKRQQRR
ncbi:hypothetical protein D8Y24_07245 [Agrococcus lahaulensis]|nr:hypothetical protein D8Y24_07245 [Agrococcus lahaulensis]